MSENSITQVGVVFLSILCHIWKIVPDLYEAITKIQAPILQNSVSAENFSDRFLSSNFGQIFLKYILSMFIRLL
jgi:hypothetical protein